MVYEGYVDSGTPAPNEVECDDCGCKCNIGGPWGDIEQAHRVEGRLICDTCYNENKKSDG